MKAPLYELQSVTLSLSGRTVLNKISFTLFSGESFVILGPSEAGKSVLLKLLGGLLRPDSGHLLYLGKPLPLSIRERKDKLGNCFGMAFQRGGLFDSLNVGDNLRVPLREWGELSQAQSDIRIRECLTQVGLSGCENLPVSQLSGGMQKRLGLARALILSPHVVLLDDPTAGLDPITSQSIADLILQLKANKSVTCISATNDPDVAFRLADRIGFLKDTRMLQIGAPENIRKNPVEEFQPFINRLTIESHDRT